MSLEDEQERTELSVRELQQGGIVKRPEPGQKWQGQAPMLTEMMHASQSPRTPPGKDERQSGGESGNLKERFLGKQFLII